MSARNEITGAEYRGKNVLRLLSAEAEHSYDESRGWAGFRQWLDAGRVVRKGEHGVACMTVITVTDGNHTAQKPRGFRVFHYDQTDEISGERVGQMVAACAFPPGPDQHRDDLRAEGQAEAERRIRERVPAEADNTPEATAARRAMFAGFGWSVTK